MFPQSSLVISWRTSRNVAPCGVPTSSPLDITRPSRFLVTVPPPSFSTMSECDGLPAVAVLVAQAEHVPGLVDAGPLLPGSLLLLLMSLESSLASPPPNVPPNTGEVTLLCRDSFGGIFCTVHAKCGFSLDSTISISVLAVSLSHQSRWQWNVCWPDHTLLICAMNVCLKRSASPGCHWRSSGLAFG